jgi:hypothetical protein
MATYKGDAKMMSFLIVIYLLLYFPQFHWSINTFSAMTGLRPYIMTGLDSKKKQDDFRGLNVFSLNECSNDLNKWKFIDARSMEYAGWRRTSQPKSIILYVLKELYQ